MVNSERYVGILGTLLVRELQQRQLLKLWSLQNGATAHSARQNTAVLRRSARVAGFRDVVTCLGQEDLQIGPMLTFL
jgi:hypothetical protein